jgi:HAD superfamily 5'-nucleotidase-like hydrolase
MDTVRAVTGTPPPGRRIYANRTLNLRGIKAIGYDLDYTLVHYRVEPWERRAYERLRAKLREAGIPVDGLEFDHELVTRGLIVDLELGNLVKANRFGYVTRASHGTRPLEFDLQRTTYGRTLAEPSDDRFVFLHTLFSISEACMYAQLVDRLDAGELSRPIGYADLYRVVRRSLDEAHMEGELKAEILAAPDAYVEPDPELGQALLDQRNAGKRLLLITNSDWAYVPRILDHALAPTLGGVPWRELFELIIVSARKPEFFQRRQAAFALASDDGLLRPCPIGIRQAGVYVGGDAAQVEAYLGVGGEDILYVGDHIYVDVHVSKAVLRWRTALILRELEAELTALDSFREQQRQLETLMEEKVRLEFALSQARLALQRHQHGDPAWVDERTRSLREAITALRARIVDLDDRVAPLARESGELGNRRWGPLMRAGNDKSHLAQQVERFADIYTSRVSNFLYETPYGYLRAPRGTLPHDDAPLVE